MTEKTPHFKRGEITGRNNKQRAAEAKAQIAALVKQLKDEHLTVLSNGLDNEQRATNYGEPFVEKVYAHFNREYELYQAALLAGTHYSYTTMNGTVVDFDYENKEEEDTTASSSTTTPVDECAATMKAVVLAAAEQAQTCEMMLGNLLAMMKEKGVDIGDAGTAQLAKTEQRVREILDESKTLQRQLEEARTANSHSACTTNAAELRAQLADAEQRVTLLERDLAATRQQVPELRKSLEDKSHRKDEEMAALQVQLAKERERNTEKEAKLREARAAEDAAVQAEQQLRLEAEGLRVTLTQRESDLTLARSAVDEARTAAAADLAREQQSHASALAERDQEMLALRATGVEGETECQRLMAGLNARLDEARLQLDARDSQLTRLQSELTSANATVAEQAVQLTQLGRARALAEAEARDLGTAAQALRVQQEQEAARFAAEQTRLSTELADAEARRSADHERAKTEAANATLASQRASALQDELDESRREEASAKGRASVLGDDFDAVRAELDEASSQLTQARNALTQQVAKFMVEAEKARLATEQLAACERRGAPETLEETTRHIAETSQQLRDVAQQLRDEEDEAAREFHAAVAGIQLVAYDGGAALRKRETLQQLYDNGDLADGGFELISTEDRVALESLLKARPVVVENRDEDSADTIEEPAVHPVELTRDALTLGTTLGMAGLVTKAQYAQMARRDDGTGTRSARLTFMEPTLRGRALALRTGALSPQIQHLSAEPELVADLSERGACALQYEYVSRLGRTYIPARGALSVERYNGEFSRGAFTELYELRPPLGAQAYGCESVVRFSDGTRLYATCVTPSIYAVDLIVLPHGTH
jgi:hypothetical protein